MKQKGFSLIEMMVVISIIILLTSIGFSLLSKESAKARDFVRRADFEQYEKALDEYYIKYNMYPCGDNPNSILDCQSGHTAGEDDFLDGPSGNPPCSNSGPTYGLITEGLLDHFYFDPLGKQPYQYAYMVSPDRQKYVLAAVLEEDEDNIMENDGGSCKNFYEAGNWGKEVEVDMRNYGYGNEWWQIKFCTGDDIEQLRRTCVKS